MFFFTDTADAPWVVIKSDDKKRARLNCMQHFLSMPRLSQQGPSRRRRTGPAHRRLQRACHRPRRAHSRQFARYGEEAPAEVGADGQSNSHPITNELPLTSMHQLLVRAQQTRDGTFFWSKTMVETDKIGVTLRDVVKFYSETYRNPHLPPFQVCEPHSMTSWWGESWRQPNRAAMWFIRPVGKSFGWGRASLTSDVGARLAAHDHQKPRRAWREQAAFVQFVSVPEAFEAPSLEEYLIKELRPTGNILGRTPIAATPKLTTSA